MCGISGFYELAKRDQAYEIMDAMALSLSHRGPDGTVTWIDGKRGVGLGHNRLSIIDIEGGRQPMFSADRRYAIVFNGEIYNFLQLRRDLEQLGVRFRTRSDTEVLLYGFALWGRDVLSRIRGMFAFCIYDAETNRLFLARDRTGIKPLYFHHGSAGFFFASELKALLSVREIPRRLDYSTLGQFLVLGYSTAPATFFVDCREVTPGSWLEVSAAGYREGQYWQWQRREQPLTKREAVDAAAAVLRETVREQLISDVPLGAFLSGGIDSSLIVALMSEANSSTVRTFTVRFGDPEYDESLFARAVANRFGTEHHELTVGVRTGDLGLVATVLDHFDQPFGDSSAIPTYLISREIRRYVKVALAGDGGDEMFGGYLRFRWADAARALGRLPAPTRRLLEGTCRVLRPIVPHASRQTLKLLRAADRKDEQRLVALSAYVFPEELPSVLTSDALRRMDGQPVSYALAGENLHDPGGAEFIDSTISKTLPGDYLRKVDHMSSAHGLEVRVPFLGEQVLEYAARIPNGLRYNFTENKLLLRELVRTRLPRSVANRAKAGFGIPLDSWLGHTGRAELRSILSAHTSRIHDLIDRQYIQLLLDGFVDANWPKGMVSRFSLYQRVYSLWALERWLTKWNPSC